MRDLANMTGNVTNNSSSGNGSTFGNFELFGSYLSLLKNTPTWMTVFSTLVSIGIMGNTLVVILIMRNKILRRNINYYIVNMAVSDGAFLVFLMLRTLTDFGVFHLYEGPVNPIFGNIICRLSFFLNSCQHVSLLTLLILSVNRFHAVSKPLLATPTTAKVRVFLIFITWVFSALLYLNQLALEAYKWAGPFAGMLCPSVLSLETLDVFYWIQMACSMSIFVVVLVLNIRIIRKLRQSRIDVALPTAQEQIRSRRIANAMKMILCSLTLYILMWSPHHIENFMFHVVSPSIYEPDVDWSLFNIFYLCLALNSTLSPLIYFVFIKEFRSVLRKTLPLMRTSTNVNQSQT